MKNYCPFKTIILGIALVSTFPAFAQKKGKDKTLTDRKYAVQFYEIKAAGRGKALPDNIMIKGGKIQSYLMEDKIALTTTPFKIVLDSTYTEDETEMHMIKIEAEHTEEKDNFKWEATIINYDIEGTVVQSKGGVEKKKYEFAGSEKTKK